ncbi:hypothetical protein GCM10009735_18550 [Actinomadura chokoriensis]
MAAAAQPLGHVAAHLAQADDPKLHEAHFPVRNCLCLTAPYRAHACTLARARDRLDGSPAGIVVPGVPRGMPQGTVLIRTAVPA